MSCRGHRCSFPSLQWLTSMIKTTISLISLVSKARISLISLVSKARISLISLVSKARINLISLVSKAKFVFLNFYFQKCWKEYFHLLWRRSFSSDIVIFYLRASCPLPHLACLYALFVQWLLPSTAHLFTHTVTGEPDGRGDYRSLPYLHPYLTHLASCWLDLICLASFFFVSASIEDYDVRILSVISSGALGSVCLSVRA